MKNLIFLENSELLRLETLIGNGRFPKEDIDGFVLLFRNNKRSNRSVVRNHISKPCAMLFDCVDSIADSHIDEVLKHIVPVF